jgi:hypothetical protein
MKKLFVLVALFTTVYVTNANAQEKPASDPAAMAEKWKEKIKPQLMEKAGLTDAEATRVLNIHFTYANRLRSFKDASAEEQKRQAEIIHNAEEKEYAAIPLSEEKIKAVNTFWEEQKKQMEKRSQEGKTKTNQ